MSYDPSQAAGTKAIQIDVNGGSVLSDDITAHTSSSFTSRNKYFVETKRFITVDSSVQGLILWQYWAGFEWAGATMRSNAVTGTYTMTDDCMISSNTPNTSISIAGTSSGGAGIVSASSSLFSYFWRL